MPSSQLAYTSYLKGSEWRKWDLHVHTKGTMKEDRFNPSVSMEDFCIDMFKRALENKIAVIGITDYFSIENYKKVESIKKRLVNNDIQHDFSVSELKKVNSILLIPNMEMRLRTQAQRSLINIHCLFNPKFINENFDNYFLSQVEYSGENLTIQGLRNLGRQNEPNQDLICNEGAYKKGVEKFTVDYEVLNKLLQKDNVRENCLVIIADGSNDGNSGLKDFPDLRLQHLKSFDGLFTSTPSSINYYLGLTNKKTEADIVNEFGSLKPCFHGSDAHKEDDLFKPVLNRYCWIKADPTFEGLKQVIHEPVGRVKIQELSPDDKASHNVISKIVIDNENIANNTIHFNPYLNVIIGGRSSGKSALLAGLASNLCGLGKIQSEDYKKYIQNTFSKGTSVYFKGSDTPYDSEKSSNERIEYFPQNKFSELAKNQKGFDEVVEEIVQKDPSYHLIEKYNNIDIPALRSKIRGLLDNYRQLRSNISECQKDIKEKPAINDLHAQKKELEIRSKTFGSEIISDLERRFYDQKNKEKEELTKQLTELETLKGSINTLQQDPIIDELALVDKIRKINHLKFKEALEKKLTELIDVFKKDWFQYLSNSEINRAEKYSELQNKITEVANDEGYLFIVNKLSKNKEAEKIIKDIGNIDRVITEVQTLGNVLNQYEKELRVIEKEIRKIFMQFFLKTKELETMFKLIPSTSSNTDNSLKITTKLAYKYDGNFKSYIANKCDQRMLNSRIDTFIEGELSAIKIHKKLNEIIKIVINEPKVLKSSYNLDDFLDGILTNSWFSFHYDVEYEGDSFHEMSEGKKSFVILKLILEFSDKKVPLLIDQPEDDLDNRAIFTELVTYLKEKKLERQIILVTHNANIVVNADSELVIVANQHGINSPNTSGKQFEYIQGSIEYSFPKNDTESRILYSQGIREHICEIMEGGTEAFKKRERRYNIQ